jgi:hypothetical protein
MTIPVIKGMAADALIPARSIRPVVPLPAIREKAASPPQAEAARVMGIVVMPCAATYIDFFADCQTEARLELPRHSKVEWMVCAAAFATSWPKKKLAASCIRSFTSGELIALIMKILGLFKVIL